MLSILLEQQHGEEAGTSPATRHDVERCRRLRAKMEPAHRLQFAKNCNLKADPSSHRQGAAQRMRTKQALVSCPATRPTRAHNPIFARLYVELETAAEIVTYKGVAANT